MTNFNTLAADRYTTKKYDPTKKLSDALVNELKDILHLSPSSINSQPWRFTFISDPELKNELSACSFHNDEKVRDASHIVVFSVIDNIELFEKQISDNLPEGAIAYYNKNIKPGTEAEIKAWMAHQVYLALGFFLSACAAKQVDSTPMEGIDTAAYDRILNMKDYKTLFAVALGYRHADDSNQPSVKGKSRIDRDKIIFSR
ncbi:NAD(P)H-dependent oxidoreductase [Mangrovibacterium marinum]|uniref:Nitroreductase/dihydropteridine reductase n=1 Tax=Mangrovibacterium marinum TaxID=1639118 RepID=A0A2T5C1W4_9BACT|nr:NAD(P)H-dependent oxidoreductase [Mangrovibacterium marinum]PTN08692.1 nitroreductase/dihydropteridine reductase [Mangrovibacterium marinum]